MTEKINLVSAVCKKAEYMSRV